jgi:hypothetical protein
MGPSQVPEIFFRMIPTGGWVKLQYGPSGSFSQAVPPGRYCFWGFLDRDSDGYLSTGSLSPFSYAEPVLVFDDTVTVRPRFETEDVVLEAR